MADAFIAAIICTGNFAFVGAVIICLIVDLKKTKSSIEEEDPHNNHRYNTDAV